ncbi:unnamed protein product [Ambrosiozyma monospora]|uniref:Unnamed protein product n=1 Tax=Ambrosiozyma monospora TaxID=43982 RepID=A0ACB5T3K4_AMBMO|nr:unnamed protein product [Ambrosiozyma monospora]
MQISSIEFRPPPEVVLDNLEVYFPNTDLDKLIINEVVTPPVSPIAESPTGPAPLVELSARKMSGAAKSASSSLAMSTLPDSSNESGGKGNSGAENNFRAKNERALSSKDDVAAAKKSNGKLSVPESSGGAKMHRMKSIRIVAQEAKRKAERQQRKSGAAGLLRRKSTKMWGQKVVEVKPGSATSKYVNKLRDQQGKYKEFAWVKGELLGVGTFGKVYLALNVTTGDMIAVKQTTITSKILNNRETREVVDTFKAEVDSLKDLDHVNIVQYLGFEMKDNVYSIFLEYVSGGSVGRLIRDYGKFPQSLSGYLTEQVLQGLSYIHSRGILHRDLKADNLLLETNGICKISDFGISKKSKDIYSNDSAMSFQGTIFWMAPEIINNTAHQGYNAKIDIWSMGCVVFEMLSGKRPWYDFAIPGAILQLGSKLTPPIPEDTKKEMSPVSRAFLDKCFAVEPEQRPTADELLKDKFCEVDPKFRFDETELYKKMRFNDKLSERKAVMILKSKGGSSQ